MLSQDKIQRIAELAALQLSPKEIKKYAKELSDILGFFEKLTEVNTEGVQPTAQITGLKNVERQDEEKECLFADELLHMSPHPITNSQIAIPKVL